MIDMWALRPGDVIAMRDGARARVKQPSQDGRWVPVEYLVSDDGDVGAEDLVAEDEIAAIETPAPDVIE